MIELSLEQAQKIILEKQGLMTKNPPTSIEEVVNRIHNIQIDTISVVSRSHNLIIFNRFNEYKEKTVWDLLEQRKIFEFWSHALCFLPIEEYPYYAWRAKFYAEKNQSWWKDWVEKNQNLINEVYKYVKKNGPTTSADFKTGHKKPAGGWWNWKEEKAALDHLFSSGKLLISYRKNFQRYYDLTERVLPANVDNELLPEEELPDYLLKIVLDSNGIVNSEELKTYTGKEVPYYLWKSNAKIITKFLEEQVKEGFLEEIKINGLGEKFFIKESDLTDFPKTNDFVSDQVSFLTPFDNLIRERYFPKRFWNFDYKIECYVPENQRIYGYYIMPILDNTQLIGRADVKVHRKEQKLELKGIYFEENTTLDDNLLERFANGVTKFASFHDCKEIVIGNVSSKEFEKSLKSLNT
ncbi:MAG: winged helix-turn-helix domain-containing protein [Asgard group archaeon]|nr:winged helix-turn-helix domain-containing protein [Asgard group archaeon]